MPDQQNPRILLIIAGGIAAVKAPHLLREFQRAGASVTPVLTRAGAQFTTPMALSALAGVPCRTEMWDLADEAQMGHIELSRAADLIVVAPATADLMAKMVAGLCDDLASTLLLATDKPVMIAPAMNVRMWEHPATQRNVQTLEDDGITIVGPDNGRMACGETGAGRMAEPEMIVEAAMQALAASRPLRLTREALITGRPLAGRHIIVTSGPTHEPIDPVRYIANRSSGAQGTAVGTALRDLGAQVTFITGPAEVTPPEGVKVVRVTTAAEMAVAVDHALPADAAVLAAAVGDWRVSDPSDHKLKKDGSGTPPQLNMTENRDILAWLSKLAQGRPQLVVGFAAETNDVIANATAKRARKGCDWILANDVSPETGIMGGHENHVTLITETGAEDWPRMGKDEVARRLALRISQALS